MRRLTITQPDKLWITSDTHFGHPLMTRLRGFDSVKEHDEAILENLNATVPKDGHLVHLGDFFFRNKYFFF